MFGFFNKGKKTQKFEMVAPISGECIPIDKVPDEAFSSKMLGDGVAIIPSNGVLVSPFDCTVSQIFDTKHAYVLKSEFDLDVLIHIGIDTVKLNGEGFENKVSASQKLSKGDVISNFDLDFLSKNGCPLHTPIIFTNMEKFKIEFNYGSMVHGQTVLCYISKI